MSGEVRKPLGLCKGRFHENKSEQIRFKKKPKLMHAYTFKCVNRKQVINNKTLKLVHSEHK